MTIKSLPHHQQVMMRALDRQRAELIHRLQIHSLLTSDQKASATKAVSRRESDLRRSSCQRGYALHLCSQHTTLCFRFTVTSSGTLLAVIIAILQWRTGQEISATAEGGIRARAADEDSKLQKSEEAAAAMAEAIAKSTLHPLTESQRALAMNAAQAGTM